MKAMLLTAGLGTRLRPVTDTVAKPAVSFLNIPLLYYPVQLMESVGLDELIVNTHYKPEQVERLARTIPGFKGRIQVSPEIDQPLGSGGGVSQARRWLQTEDDFFVANGDEVIIPSTPDVLPKLLEHHRSTKAFATILVMRHPGVGSQFGGVWTDAKGGVHGFGKQRPTDVPEDTMGFHYIGVIALSSRVFRYLPEGVESNLLYDALVGAIRDGERVQIFEDRCLWYETGNISDFVEATGLCLQKLQHEPDQSFLKTMAARFWPGFTDRPSFWRGNVNRIEIKKTNALCLIGNHVTANGPVDVEGFAVVGDNAHIGRGCRLEKCVLLPGAKVPDGAHLYKTMIAPEGT